MRAHDADLAYCGWQNVGEGITAQPYAPPAYEEEDAVAHFVRSCPWPIHAALVKRCLVERLGGFSERRFASMDYDFWLRALGAGARIKRVSEVLAFYRWHDLGQLSAVKWRQVLDALDARQRFIRDHHAARGASVGRAAARSHRGPGFAPGLSRLLQARSLSAQKLFRHAAARGSYRLRDLRHVASALLPLPLYRGLVMLAERRTR